MESTPPPLTSSPYSSPETFRSESPILVEYARPNFGGAHHRIKPSYEPCVAALPIMDGQNSLPPLDSTTSAPGWTSGSMVQPLPALSLPNILSADYDPFAHYEPGMGGSYSHDVYTSQQSQGAILSHTNSIVGTPSRSPDPTGRHGSSYPRMA